MTKDGYKFTKSDIDGNYHCSTCDHILTDDNWSPCLKRKNRYTCKQCVSKRAKEKYTPKHSKKNKIRNKNKRRTIKLEVLKYYGNKCVLCCESNPLLLSLDHINGGGSKHRKEILGTNSGSAFYAWVLKNKPDNLRILCFNCNCKINMTIINLIEQYNISGLCKYCGCTGLPKHSRVCKKCRSILKSNNRIKRRLMMLNNYGNCCMRCKTDNPEFLTIDHINNNGAEHRKSVVAGKHMWLWIEQHNYPKDNYQVLCFNCNYLKHFEQLEAV